MTRNPTLPIPSSVAPSMIATDQPVRVAVVSDDPLMKNALTGLIAQLGEARVVPQGEAEVVLWDPGPDSERALARMRELRDLGAPAVAVIGSAAHLAPALAAGARGVVLRGDVGVDRPSASLRDGARSGDAGPFDLGAALTAVKHGLTVIDHSLAPALTSSVPARATPPGSPSRARVAGELTERERQVVTLLAEGLSNKLIADRLGISDHTAKFHVNGVMAKLGAGTRTEAVVEAVRRGLVTL